MHAIPTRTDREQRLLTISQVADRWQVSERTVRRWIADGLLPAVRFGRLVRLRDADVRAFEAEHLDVRS